MSDDIDKRKNCIRKEMKNNMSKNAIKFTYLSQEELIEAGAFNLKMAIEALGGRIWIEGDKEIPRTIFKFSVKIDSHDSQSSEQNS